MIRFDSDVYAPEALLMLMLMHAGLPFVQDSASHSSACLRFLLFLGCRYCPVGKTFSVALAVLCGAAACSHKTALGATLWLSAWHGPGKIFFVLAGRSASLLLLVLVCGFCLVHLAGTPLVFCYGYFLASSRSLMPMGQLGRAGR